MKSVKILRNGCMLMCLAGMMMTSCSENKDKRWKLVYEEDFNSGKLDSTVWKRTERNGADWGNTQSSDPRCLTFRDGCLVLRGIVNDDLQADTAHFLTGGVVTQGLKALPSPGRYEVRARLHKAQGAWPAIWLLPFDGGWPNGGEIDIMERLNGDSIAYQTIHSGYTYTMGRNDPPHGGQGVIDPDGFNVYGVDILPDSIVCHINGVKTLCYPRVPEEEANGQYPFLRPQYMLIDMQLGGSWVGKVNPEDLPVDMEIDWVRVYELNEEEVPETKDTLAANTMRWDFDNLDGWVYEHQDTATVHQASLENGYLLLKTRANIYDRTKMHTESREFGAGDYRWRLYVPYFAPKGQVSIAGWIYRDADYELDFEIGYGTEEARKEYNAKDNELLAYMTNQQHPTTSTAVPILPGWHDLRLNMDTNEEGNYEATWLIDEKTVKELTLEFGPKDATFHIYCSLENLGFLGDELPKVDNVAKFNYVTFTPKE